ncbi:MAG: hypothetical protein Q8Q56_02175 [Alphaproteobacteria bacterium]|nr:hypothetical protein [Alphaproteobacteria bacterium]
MKTFGVIYCLSLLTLFSVSHTSAASAGELVITADRAAEGFVLSPLLYSARSEAEKSPALEGIHSILLIEESLGTERGEYPLSITPDSLYESLPADLSRPVRTQISLNAFRIDLLPGIATKLEDIAEKTMFEELCILQCSSIKFNRLFPTIRELFKQKKIHRLIYTADADGVQTPAAARRGMEELLRSPTTRRTSVPAGTPGREGSAIAVEEPKVLAAADVREFLYKTEIKLEQTEDGRVSEEYNAEIRDFGLTRTTAFIRLPDEIEAIRRKVEDLSETDKDVIRAISFADTSLDDSTLEGIADLLLDLPNLKILDLSSTPITEDSYPVIKRILAKESIAFVNITMTELVEHLFEDDGFVQSLEENVDHVKKLIWLPLEERDLTPQIAGLEEKYREAVRGAHQTFGRITRVLDHLEEREETQEMTRKILDEAS